MGRGRLKCDLVMHRDQRCQGVGDDQHARGRRMRYRRRGQEVQEFGDEFVMLGHEFTRMRRRAPRSPSFSISAMSFEIEIFGPWGFALAEQLKSAESPSQSALTRKIGHHGPRVPAGRPEPRAKAGGIEPVAVNVGFTCEREIDAVEEHVAAGSAGAAVSTIPAIAPVTAIAAISTVTAIRLPCPSCVAISICAVLGLSAPKHGCQP